VYKGCKECSEGLGQRVKSGERRAESGGQRAESGPGLVEEEKLGGCLHVLQEPIQLFLVLTFKRVDRFRRG
jgi:hypothetical protein